MNKIPDSSWSVVSGYFRDFYGQEVNEDLRKHVESSLKVTPFPGGVFLSQGESFDVFVEKEFRGNWNAPVVLTEFVNSLIAQYGRAEVTIREDNVASLKLAHKYGFEIIGRDGDGDLILEKCTWAE